MMKKINWVTALLIPVLIGATWGVSYFSLRQKNGFIRNQRVFDEFKGTKKLQEKIAKKKQEDAALLDSLYRLAAQKTSLEAIQKYQLERDNIQLQEQQLVEQYTTEIWSHINADISVYGKEHGYDFILGASGNGSLMHAKASTDITEEIIKYINSRYDGK